MPNDDVDDTFEDNDEGSRNLVPIILAIWGVIAVGLIATYAIYLSKNPSVTPAANQLEAKLKPYNDRLAQNPNDFEAMIGIGQVYSDAGKTADALSAFQRALAVQPNNLDAIVDVGATFMQMGQGDDAIAQFEKALSIDPKYDYALLMKAMYLAEVKRDYQTSLDILHGVEKSLPPGNKLNIIKQNIADIEQARQKAAGTAPTTSTVPAK